MKALTIDELGRITLPQEVQEALGLRPGEVLSLEIEDGRLILGPAHDQAGLRRKGKVLIWSGNMCLKDIDWVAQARAERLDVLLQQATREDSL